MGFLKEPSKNSKSQRKKSSSQSVEQNVDAGERSTLDVVDQCVETQVEGIKRKTSDENSLSCVIICSSGPFVDRILPEEIETAKNVGLGVANNGQPVAIPLSLNPVEFTAFIWKLFPPLHGTAFSLAHSKAEDMSRLVSLPSSLRTPADIHARHKLSADSALYVCPKRDFMPMPTVPVIAVASVHIEPPSGSSDDEDSEPDTSRPRRKKRRRRGTIAASIKHPPGTVISVDGVGKGGISGAGKAMARRGRARSKAENTQVSEAKGIKGRGHRGRLRVGRRKGPAPCQKGRRLEESSSDVSKSPSSKQRKTASPRRPSTLKPEDASYLMVKRSSSLVTSVMGMSRRPDSWTSLSGASSTAISAVPSSLDTMSSHESVKLSTKTGQVHENNTSCNNTGSRKATILHKLRTVHNTISRSRSKSTRNEITQKKQTRNLRARKVPKRSSCRIGAGSGIGGPQPKEPLYPPQPETSMCSTISSNTSTVVKHIDVSQAIQEPLLPQEESMYSVVVPDETELSTNNPQSPASSGCTRNQSNVCAQCGRTLPIRTLSDQIECINCTQNAEYSLSLAVDKKKLATCLANDRIEVERAIRTSKVQHERYLQLGQEPSNGFAIKIKLPDNTTLIRKFLSSDNLLYLMNFIGCQPSATAQFSITVAGGAEHIPSELASDMLCLADVHISSPVVIHVEWDSCEN